MADGEQQLGNNNEVWPAPWWGRGPGIMRAPGRSLGLVHKVGGNEVQSLKVN